MCATCGCSDGPGVRVTDPAGGHTHDEHSPVQPIHTDRMLLEGRAQPSGIKQRGADATLLLVLNAHYDLVNFTLPGHAGDERWRLLIDTNVEGKLEKTAYGKGDVYGVTGRSLLLFQLLGVE